MFTIYNTTLIAVMQVGVIVAGVLASGLWHKFSLDSHIAMSFPAALFYRYGMVGFAIPFIWLGLALWLRRSPGISDGVKGLAFWSGVIVLIALAAFVLYADISPVFLIMWSLSSGDNDA